MTVSTTTQDEVKIKQAAGDWFVRRMRESGLAGRTIGSLTPTEKQTFDRAIAEHDALEVRLRENAGDGLVDLPGVPMVDPAERRAASVLEPELPDDGKLVSLAEHGVPMTAGYDPAAAQQGLEKMRESEAADSDELLDLGALGVMMREGTYGGEGGTDTVYYEDQATRQDVADLYAVVPELTPAGSPNLENSKLRGVQEEIERGHQLSPVQLGVVRELMQTYGPAVRKLRESPDREGQDLHAQPDPGTARLVDRPEQPGEGLIDLGPLTKAAA